MGKLLTGPWMRKFYKGAADQIDHIAGIALVRQVVHKMKEYSDPIELLGWERDFFDEPLDFTDTTLEALKTPSKDSELFKKMLQSCVTAAVNVLELQYKKEFQNNVTDKLLEETKSARTHNIDAEELMRMYSSLKKKSSNATICFLSCKMRAKTNRTVEYLDAMNETIS